MHIVTNYQVHHTTYIVHYTSYNILIVYCNAVRNVQYKTMCNLLNASGVQAAVLFGMPLGSSRIVRTLPVGTRRRVRCNMLAHHYYYRR